MKIFSFDKMYRFSAKITVGSNTHHPISLTFWHRLNVNINIEEGIQVNDNVVGIIAIPTTAYVIKDLSLCRLNVLYALEVKNETLQSLIQQKLRNSK